MLKQDILNIYSPHRL